MIEDACEAIGASYRGRPVGGIGDFGVFGFYPNKPITTGEGGMVVTRDAQYGGHDAGAPESGQEGGRRLAGPRLLGYNYRLSELNCALGHRANEKDRRRFSKRARQSRCDMRRSFRRSPK